ncbi:hypothetical protein GCM10023149_35530 [Mucilaginibacter gynuensis]|uniref:DUF4488 domain-containing protein n=1 Tax=Mucilaginibacter gynuensis TaxID=1302236 RepID=A0ABP8GV15_9SPHI
MSKPKNIIKINLKFIVALLCLYFAVTTAFAQNKKANKKAIVGIWELSMIETNGQPLQATDPGHLKLFNADGTFANIKVLNTGSVISHSGKYTVDNTQSYTETALYRITENANDPLGKGFKINYAFSDDKNSLTLKLIYKDGVTSTEVWRKL